MGAAILIDYCDSGTTTECLNAGEAVDDECSANVTTANPAVCTGECDRQLSAAANACADSVSLIVARYNKLGHNTSVIVPYD